MKSSLLYIFPVIHDRYLLDIAGFFFKNHSNFYTCVEEFGVASWELRLCKGDTSIHLRKRDKDAQCTQLVEWGGGVRGSKDNYKGQVNKVRK
jgi:hypothetical protein